MKHTFLFLLLILLLGLTACSKPADRTLVYSVVKTVTIQNWRID